MRGTAGALAVGLVCLITIASAGPADADEAQELLSLSGWSDGVRVQYYNLGENTQAESESTVAIAPVWLPIHGFDDDGSPLRIDGQGTIFDANVGDPEYSDLWQVSFVTVPEDYEPDSIRSLDDIEASGFPVEQSDMLVNCPFVLEGTVLEGGEQVHPGWVDGEEVFYLDFGPTENRIGQAWLLVEHDAGDEPSVDDAILVFDSAPGDDDYSPFRRVNVVRVPDDTDLRTLTSEADILTSGLEIERAETIYNMPIGSVDGAEPPASSPAYEDADASPHATLYLAIVLGILALGATVIGGAFFVAQRRQG